jgi:hypothetical protein
MSLTCVAEDLAIARFQYWIPLMILRGFASPVDSYDPPDFEYQAWIRDALDFH